MAPPLRGSGFESGAFTGGAGSLPQYDGEAMARETQTCVDLFPTPEAREAVQRFATRKKD